MKKELRNEEQLGRVAGLYSQGIRCGAWIFTTQIGNARGGDLAGEGAYEQALQALRNAEVLLGTEGANLGDVVKCTIYLSDLADCGALNRAYEERMPKPYPARACVEVARLGPGVRVEIELVACVES